MISAETTFKYKPPIIICDLRKTALTNLIQAGIDPKTVTSMTGHEDLRNTLMHDAKTSPESMLAGLQALVSAVDVKKPGLRISV